MNPLNDATAAGPGAMVDLRAEAVTAQRAVESLIPMVQRSAGRAAIVRAPRLEIGVGPEGEVSLRFVANVVR